MAQQAGRLSSRSPGRKADRTRRFKQWLRQLLAELERDKTPADRLVRALLLKARSGTGDSAAMPEDAPPKAEWPRLCERVVEESAPLDTESTGGPPPRAQKLASAARSRHRRRSAASAAELSEETALAETGLVNADWIWRAAQRQGFRCAISRLPFSKKFESPGAVVSRPFWPSIDRRDPNKGYTEDNIQLVCNLANFAKDQWSEEALVEFCKAVAEKQSETG